MQRLADEYVDGGYKNGAGEEYEALPSVEGLATYLGVARSTVYKWADEEDKCSFSDTLEKLLSKQATMLINKGLIGDFNSNIVKMMLSSHGYADRKQTEHSMSSEMAEAFASATQNNSPFVQVPD
jgi:hypothetical protein